MDQKVEPVVEGAAASPLVVKEAGGGNAEKGKESVDEQKTVASRPSMKKAMTMSSGKMKLFNAVAKVRETKIHNWNPVASENLLQLPKTIAAESASAVAEELKTRLAQTETEGDSRDSVNTLATLSMDDIVSYILENRIASDNSYPFQLLAMNTSGFLVLFGVLWYTLSKDLEFEEGEEELFGHASPSDGIFMALQLIVSSGFEEIPDVNGLRYLFFAMIFFGLVVFAVLVGFITDAVSQFMESLAVGRTKVAEDGHTLILGWNEATLRCIVQISFLRRTYQELNETKYFGLLYVMPVLRPLMLRLKLLEEPSTPLAVADIVVMTDTIPKSEMHHQLELTLAERGIDSHRTKLGQNIICRIGDPTNVNDLIRVGAHRAAAILVMLTEQDEKEEDESDMMIQNGATLRSCLALRHILFTNPYEGENVRKDLRVVLQMTKPSEYVDAACFKHPADLDEDGVKGERDVILPMDLSRFLNSLMFTCAAQPGLSRILLNMLDFEGKAIRQRIAKHLRSGPDNKQANCVHEKQTFGELRREFSKAVFIGILRPSMRPEEIQERGFGLCPDPDIVIEKEDILIFVGPKPSPDHSYEMLKTFDNYLDTAGELIDKYPAMQMSRQLQSASNSKVHSNLLVCGWRAVWQERPDRLHDRVMEIVTQRLPGSTITFLNSVDPEEFSTLMTGQGLKKAQDVGGHRVFEMPAPYEKIFIRHILGDAAQASVLSPVIMESTVHTVIVLGTQASVRLGARFRDTRVLNVMLLLRKLWEVKNEGVPMHIVGENNEDMTARLALAPKRKRGTITEKDAITEHEPDFVNSQAVYARALVQTLAYPQIRPAMDDLFEESEGTAGIAIVNASAYVPLEGKEMKYGVIRSLVLKAKGERSICIGILKASNSSGVPLLLPDHDKPMTLCEKDRLVIIRRKLGVGVGKKDVVTNLFSKGSSEGTQ